MGNVEEIRKNRQMNFSLPQISNFIMKNNMRTIEEKESIIKELLSGKLSWREISEKYNLSYSVLFKWKNNFKSRESSSNFSILKFKFNFIELLV